MLFVVVGGDVNMMLTWRRREKGRHSLKVSLLRKLLKNSGQEGSVKLFPRLESKGRGKSVDIGADATMEDSEIDDVVEGAGMPDDPSAVADVVAGELLESSCRAWIPIRGFGAGRWSNTSSRSRMLDPCTLA